MNYINKLFYKEQKHISNKEIKKGSCLLKNNFFYFIDFYGKEDFLYPTDKLKNKKFIFINDIQYNENFLMTNKITKDIYLKKNKLFLNFIKNMGIIQGRIIKRKNEGFLIGVLGKIFFIKTNNILSLKIKNYFNKRKNKKKHNYMFTLHPIKIESLKLKFRSNLK